MMRFAAGVAAVAAFAAAGFAQTGGPKHAYGHNLRVRPGGKKDFTAETPRVGVEAFHDAAGGALLFVTESGNIAVTAFAPPGEKREAVWAFAHDLRVRKAEDQKFTGAKKVGVEVFKDLASGKLLYISEATGLALADTTADLKTDKEPAFHHGLTLPVRAAKATEWKGAKAFGVEAFTDGNTGGLLYVTDAGMIATAAAPAKAPVDTAIAKPKPLHGLTLRVRAAGEKNFSDATKNLSVEVYADPNSGGLLYISETGSIAAVPAPAAAVKANQKIVWKHAFNVKARKGGDKEFTKAAVFGVEAFEDAHTGYTVYATETGSIAVLVRK